MSRECMHEQYSQVRTSAACQRFVAAASLAQLPAVPQSTVVKSLLGTNSQHMRAQRR